MTKVDELAAEIRRVDGSHSLGAGALADALMPWVDAELDALRARANDADELWRHCKMLRRALKAACDDGRADGEGAFVGYVRDAAALSATPAEDGETRTDIVCLNCGASASLPLGMTCSDHRPVPAAAPAEGPGEPAALVNRLAEERW